MNCFGRCLGGKHNRCSVENWSECKIRMACHLHSSLDTNLEGTVVVEWEKHIPTRARIRDILHFKEERP